MKLDLDTEELCLIEEASSEEVFRPDDSSGGALTDSVGRARLTIGDLIELSRGLWIDGYRLLPYGASGIDFISFYSPIKREAYIWLSSYSVDMAAAVKLSREREKRRCVYFFQYVAAKL